MRLDLDPDELSTCVQCGLCLSSCPTFRVTGDETRSPRGRIALMRALEDGDATVTDEVVDAISTCVQCRSCETACPSAVPFGHLMERTKESLARAGHLAPRWQRALYAPLTRPRLLRAASRALAVAQRAHLVPSRLGLPPLPLRSKPLRASGDDVFLFTGCVMDAWQREIHRDSQEVIEALGFGVSPTGDRAPCCGALHAHAGLGDAARRAAQQAMGALEGDQPVLVDSAGCGAALKDYGHLLGTDEAHRFSARVQDIHEWLAPLADRLPVMEPLDLRVAVQDPCHLRHVQRSHLAVRTVLTPVVRQLVELDDDGMCCGAGGAYSALEPELAGDIRERKLASIERAAPDVIASANPGCAMHLAARGAPTVHPMTLVASAVRAPSQGSA